MNKSFLYLLSNSLLVILLLSTTPSYAADKIQLVATGTNKAIIIFNGERIVLTVGQSNHEQVEIVSADSERVIIRTNGKEVRLESGEIAAPVLDEELSEPIDAPVSYDKKITLWADSSGFFYAQGKINRRSARFLVDTGADTVTFSSATADQLGIDYSKGREGIAATASGYAPLKSVTLKKLDIEGITLRNVVASVIYGRFPDTPLLGGTFLNKLNMTRTGNKMVLTKR